jgi:hypothetical protein
VSYHFNLAGQTNMNTATVGSAPLTGTIDAVMDLSTKAYTADLVLKPTTGKMTAMGIFAMDVAMSFQQVGKTTGTLSNGILISHSKMYVQFDYFKIYGFYSLGGGPDCKTETPIDVTLQSAPDKFFNPLQGGAITGTFTLPALVNCGYVTGVISSFAQGAGNTISMNLTP